MDNRMNYRFVNGYTRDKLFVAVISALRSYNELGQHHDNRISLQQIIDASVSIYKERKYEAYDHNVLRQLRTILCLNNPKLEEQTSGFMAVKDDGIYVITACFGDYHKFNKLFLDDVIDPDIVNQIQKAESTGEKQFDEHAFAIYIKDDYEVEHILYMTIKRPISEWDRNLIDIFCGGVTTSYNLLHKESIRDTRPNEILFALGEVAEARTKVIGNHVERVAAYVNFLCEHMGMDDVKAGLITNASTVHDIGKLNIADAILNKPGKLTKEEFEQVKDHAYIGYEILKNATDPLLVEAANIAYAHHEKYDGTGYPRGIKGEEIPLSARIVALADVIDALSSDTAYKKPWPMEQIVELIHKERGKHFDPEVVDVFIKHLEQFIELKTLITLT